VSPRKPKAPAKRRGLVLGAGGVLGASWTIGALKAVQDATGWDPREAEVLIGTSAGSVLAAFVGNGIGVEQLLNHQRGIVAPGDPVIEYDADHERALPQLPKLGLGSARLLRSVALHPTKITPMGAMAGIMPRGRGSLAPVGALVEAICPRGMWAPRENVWIVAMDYDTGKRIPFGRTGAPPAGLSEAVMASCAIPGWYAPVEIGGRRYVDGGACSPTSVDLVIPLELDEVFVLSPMTSFDYDRPSSRIARVERQFRRVVTRRLIKEAVKVRKAGTAVVMLGPGAEDLEAMGANLMDARRRTPVLETSLRTSAENLRRHYGDLAAAG
jgi:NTE family protein